VLRVTRDGIQYIHDQTIRGMNKGMVPDELAEQITLPPYLAQEKPYLQEFYGTVKHSVRQIYQGYLGWFSGDPVDLDPIPRVERSRRYVELMGGHDVVLRHAAQAYQDRDYQWAAELATHLIRLDHEDMTARNLKADSFRMLGYASINANWRYWYLTSAMELDGSLDVGMALRRLQAAISSPDLLAALPASSIVEGLGVWLKAEDTTDTNLLLIFNMTDSGERYGLEIRRSVAQFYPHPVNESVAGRADATLALNKLQLLQLISGALPVAEAIDKQQVSVSGDGGAAVRFFGCFDRPQPINLTVR
jgi:alkyl sulfatase BDS1-like metallo-beta-lactamase superfamily hydrolase